MSMPVRNDRNFAGFVVEPLAGTRYASTRNSKFFLVPVSVGATIELAPG